MQTTSETTDIISQILAATDLRELHGLIEDAEEMIRTMDSDDYRRALDDAAEIGRDIRDTRGDVSDPLPWARAYALWAGIVDTVGHQAAKAALLRGAAPDGSAAAQAAEDAAEDLAYRLRQVLDCLPTWGPPPADLVDIYSYDSTHCLVQSPGWVLEARRDVVEITEAVLYGDAQDVIAMLPGTQAARAERIGVTQQAVQSWAAGNKEMSTLARHMVLALLGYQVDEDGHWARVR